LFPATNICSPESFLVIIILDQPVCQSLVLVSCGVNHSVNQSLNYDIAYLGGTELAVFPEFSIFN